MMAVTRLLLFRVSITQFDKTVTLRILWFIVTLFWKEQNEKRISSMISKGKEILDREFIFSFKMKQQTEIHGRACYHGI